VFSAALKPLLKPGVHKLIGCSRRMQGLMLRASGATERRLSLADLPGSGLRFVNRQPGSGTRLLMDHLLQTVGVDASAIPGYAARPEDSHLAVAAAIAAGQADVGPGIEAAAREFGLDFVPLVEEDYFLVCLKDALDTPSVRALRAVLESADWPAALQQLPGYGAPDAGQVLSLTKALPWWHFKTPKPHGG
jgi:putative molybdopterin biosynthesis protein